MLAKQQHTYLQRVFNLQNAHPGARLGSLSPSTLWSGKRNRGGVYREPDWLLTSTPAAFPMAHKRCGRSLQDSSSWNSRLDHRIRTSSPGTETWSRGHGFSWRYLSKCRPPPLTYLVLELRPPPHSSPGTPEPGRLARRKPPAALHRARPQTAPR